MTEERAIQVAADWWVDAVKAGVWDNGDAETELHHAAFRSMAPKLTEADLPLIRAAVVEVLEEEAATWERRGAEWLAKSPAPYHMKLRFELYSDYGNNRLDEACRKRGSKFICGIHGPQKAGTQIHEQDDGLFIVRAKGGYGADWIILEDSSCSDASSQTG